MIPSLLSKIYIDAVATTVLIKKLYNLDFEVRPKRDYAVIEN